MLFRSKASNEEKVELMQKGYEAISNASIKIVSQSIDTVLLPDSTVVTDRAMILEWVIDMPKPDYAILEKAIMTTNSQGIDKDIKLTCTECNEIFTSKLDMNPTTFFA